MQYFRDFIFEDHPIKQFCGFCECSSHIARPSPCRRLSIIDHKCRQRDTACYGFSNIRRFTSRYMYQNCAQSAVQNESKTGKFQQSGHACLRKTTSGAANVAAC